MDGGLPRPSTTNLHSLRLRRLFARSNHFNFVTSKTNLIPHGQQTLAWSADQG
jgi:hypothetical protein